MQERSRSTVRTDLVQLFDGRLRCNGFYSLYAIYATLLGRVSLTGADDFAIGRFQSEVELIVRAFEYLKLWVIHDWVVLDEYTTQRLLWRFCQLSLRIE